MADPDFDEFWLVYPRKVGKLKAQTAYKIALRQTTPQALLDGVDRYKRHKPSYADWCHPSTWLRQGRWMDDWTETSAARASVWDTCPHRPVCGSEWQCAQRTALAAMKANQP